MRNLTTADISAISKLLLKEFPEWTDYLVIDDSNGEEEPKTIQLESLKQLFITYSNITNDLNLGDNQIIAAKGSFGNIINNLEVNEEGYILDARQGKVLHELIKNLIPGIIWQTQVLDIVKTPPSYEERVDGDRWIVDIGAVGDFSGFDGMVAEWIDQGAETAWMFYEPEERWGLFVKERYELFMYYNNVWTSIGSFEGLAEILEQAKQVRDDILDDPGFQAVKTDLLGPNKIGITADSISDVNIVANIKNNVVTVAGIVQDVSDVAGIKAAISNLSPIKDNITAVDGNKININKLAAIDNHVTLVSGIVQDVSTVAGIDGDVTNVASIKQDVTDVASIKSNVTNVANIKDNVVAVDGNKTNINAVHANKNNIDIVATNINNVNKVGAIDQDVTDVADIKDDVVKVADIDGDVSKVANIDTDVSAVANIDTDVTDVASIKQDVSDVAGIKTAVSNLSPIKDNIVAVDGNKANINAVKANETNINAVKANENNINAVAGNSTNINAVKNNETNINAVANNKNNIDKVANINNDVTKVANIDTDVSAVALIDDDVTDVALIKQDVTDVAGIKTNVTNVAGIKDNVVAVDGNKANINAVHANKTNIDAVAGNKTNIDAVKNNSANINTVAGNLSGANTIGTVAGSISNVNNVGGNIGNVNAVASNKSNIDAVAGNKSNIDTVAGMKDNINALAPHSQAVADLGARTAELDLVAEALEDIDDLEKVNNKVTEWNSPTDTEYPSAKLVHTGLLAFEKDINILLRRSGLLGYVSPGGWDEIADITQQGDMHLYYDEGDEFQTALKFGNDWVPAIVRIIGLDKDKLVRDSSAPSTTFEFKDILWRQSFDSREPNNSDSNRKSNGNNNWGWSNLRQYLNSENLTFVYGAKHPADAPPDNYDADSLAVYEGPGFLARLDPELASVIAPVKKWTALNTVVDGGGAVETEERVFLLSQKEVGLGNEGTVTNEFVYNFYNGAVYADRIKLEASGSAYHWWLRSPLVSCSDYVRHVYTYGSLSNSYARYSIGVAPAFVIG